MKKKLRTAAAGTLFSLIAAAAAAAPGQTPAQGPVRALGSSPTPEQAKAIDAVFAAYAQAGSPGCALTVLHDQKPWYRKAYGYADLAHQIPIDPEHTVFDIGSTSKQFMAASILLLVQDGKLKLDDDIRRYLPEMPDYGTPITVDHLLHHTSGIRDYIGLMMVAGIREEDFTTREQALRVIVRQKALDFVPGTQYSYSNSGYFLLSQILERIEGKTWPAFAQERIFKPLAMEDTLVLDQHERWVRNKASSYVTREDGSFAVSASDWEQTGDGAVQTTATDLAKWDANFYQPRVGGAWMVARLQEAGRLADGKPIEYARGLIVSGEGPMLTVRHSGAWAGYRAEFLRRPEQSLSVIALCNLAESDPDKLVDGVVAALSPASDAATDARASRLAATARPVKKPERFAGVWWHPESARVRTLAVSEGQLLFQRDAQGGDALLQLDANTLTLPAAEVPVRLSFREEGGRSLMVIDSPDEHSVFQRVEAASDDPAALAALAGEWWSEELNASWNIRLQGDKLFLLMEREEPLVLTPRFRDAFAVSDLLLRVQRDAQQRVNGFAIDLGRARDVRFVRK